MEFTNCCQGAYPLMDIIGFDIWVKYKILADALEGFKFGPQNMQKVSQ
jgi:hypothetical protein